MDKAIKKIVLDLGKKEITLTAEQAVNLKKALDELFGKDIIREVHHHDSYLYPYWYYRQSPRWQDNTVWCSGSGTSVYGTFIGNSGTLRLTA